MARKKTSKASVESMSSTRPTTAIKNDPVGKWRIVETEIWDTDYTDTEEPGFIAFEKRGEGELHFGCIQAVLDWRHNPDTDRVEFSFSGFDESTALYHNLFAQPHNVEAGGETGLWVKPTELTKEGFVSFVGCQ